MLTIHYSGHFAVCTNVKSLCCILESNIMLHVKYTLIKNETINKRKRARYILRNYPQLRVILKSMLLRKKRNDKSKTKI